MQQWEELKAECLGCNKCELSNTRTNVVFGVGNINSRVMFVGEGPGENEDLQGEPFVGRAGKLLDKYLAAIDLDRTKVYIANMVKCRPPHNRDPKPEEVEKCLPFLRRQVQLIRPAIIVCLGRIAACRLISPGFRVTKDHGVWYEKGGIKFMGTFHPAALLRNPNNKADAFEDFLKIRDELKNI
ncbi:MAG TPA: uracil-DNA glycosylase [Clostridiales bacterium]|nr:uracil-DNA glycosylase [Clostridiales bacterium]